MTASRSFRTILFSYGTFKHFGTVQQLVTVTILFKLDVWTVYTKCGIYPLTEGGGGQCDV